MNDRREFVDGARHAGPPSAMLPLNHLFAVIDRETAAAADRSTLLAELADFRTSHVVANGGESWTGRYLSMRTTYVEFFGAGDAADFAGEGSIGLALGGDRPGLVDAFVARAALDDTKVERLARRRGTGAGEIEWFVGARRPDEPEGTAITVDVWTMEYLSSYMAHPASTKRASLGPDDDVSRARYNDGNYRGAPFADLASVTFDIERERFASRVRPMLVAAGYRLSEREDGVGADGGETGIDFRYAAKPALRALDIRLSRDEPRARSESIGRSTLTVGPGARAAWTFTVMS
jgi:hypothetical protein